LSGAHQQLELIDFQLAMFSAGHGHAGVLVILALIAQFLPIIVVEGHHGHGL
jgi:hypothetical protein